MAPLCCGITLGTLAIFPQSATGQRKNTPLFFSFLSSCIKGFSFLKLRTCDDAGFPYFIGLFLQERGSFFNVFTQADQFPRSQFPYTPPRTLSSVCSLFKNVEWWASYSVVWMCTVMSDSLQPRGLQSTRLLCPWHSPGKNTGVGCCFLLQGIFPIQGSKAGLLPCRQFLYRLSHITFPVTLLTTYKY